MNEFKITRIYVEDKPEVSLSKQMINVITDINLPENIVKV
jgi:hypothetical protein